VLTLHQFTSLLPFTMCEKFCLCIHRQPCLHVFQWQIELLLHITLLAPERLMYYQQCMKGSCAAMPSQYRKLSFSVIRIVARCLAAPSCLPTLGTLPLLIAIHQQYNVFEKSSVTIKKCDEIFRPALGWIFRILVCIKNGLTLCWVTW
jgi:hypothetical protein